MPPERQPGHGHLEAKLTRERAAVLNHAYGFVSRGNRQGGLRHITGWIQGEADIDSAYRWFIEQMMAWESADAALALAQSYLSRLLEQRRDIEALKLINRCLLENAEFKPLPGDRAKALAAAKRQGNEELLRILMD